MPEETNDKKLVKELRKGDLFSFDEIFKKYNKKVYSFSLSYLKNKEDAEGIVQEVFMNLWRNRTNLKEQYNINSYLYTITLNAIRKRFRKLAREKKHLEDYAEKLVKEEDLTNTAVVYNNLLELAQKSIGQLPPRQKEIYLLSREEELTNEEISKKLRISKKTVENHLYRAKTFLKKAIGNVR